MAGTVADTATLAVAEQRQRRVRLFGCVLLILAESMIFITLLALRFVLAGTGRPVGLDPVLTGLLTALMAASFGAVYLAHRAARRDRWPQAGTGLLAAAVLGLLATAGVGYGWAGLDVPVGSRFGEVFYVTTAAHAFHVVVGALFLIGLAVQARQGRLAGNGGRVTVEAAYWFWKFLFVVWIAVYVVFYLL